MKSFKFIISLKNAVFLLMLLPHLSWAQQKPNLILIVTDDQGYGDLGCFGAKDLETPNIDTLAASGVRFTQWYANSPVCAPSRASLMTGLYPHNAGVPDLLAPRSPGLSLDRVTIAEALKKEGYGTGIFGKWHLGAAQNYLPNQRGFDQFFGHLEGTLDYFSHMYYLARAPRPFHDLWRNTEETWEEGNYMTHLITQEAVQFIRDYQHEPFFLYVAFNAPHQPLHMPKKYLEQFSHLDAQRQRMAAMLAVVDEGVGNIMSTLKQLGLRENTVIFFMSDNGGANNAKNFLSNEPEQFYYGANNGGLKGHKGSVFEGGIRVPAFMSWPAMIRPGIMVKEPAMGMDIFPTFLKIAGAELPDYPLDGHDVLPLIQAGKKSLHDMLFWEYAGQHAVREGKWKLSMNAMLDFRRPGPGLFLADLDTDPSESINYADKFPEKVAALRAEFEKWYTDVRTKATPVSEE